MRMKKVKLMVVLAMGLLIAQAPYPIRVAAAGESGTTSPEEKSVLKTKKDMESYAVGVETARNFKRQQMDLDPDLVIRGITDAMKGNKLLLSEEDILNTMITFTGEMKVKQGQVRLALALDNKKEGEEFLAANKTKKGVKTLPSGLQYKIIKAGHGKKPIETDIVEFSFRGTLINGTDFDGTDRTGKPVIFKLSDTNLIPGLREALKLMPVGSKWQIFIPSQLAYGSRPVGTVIGPNSTLIFELELLGIKDAVK
jgi:FKBP-type peptidyl-prolyl cis-trans isomerase